MPAEPSDRPPIDFSGALERMGGDREMLCEQMRYFLDDAPKLLDEISAGIENSDLDPLQNAAHRLKSLLRGYDCDTAADLAFRLENIATFVELNHAIGLLEKLRPHVEHLLNSIRNYITP